VILSSSLSALAGVVKAKKAPPKGKVRTEKERETYRSVSEEKIFFLNWHLLVFFFLGAKNFFVLSLCFSSRLCFVCSRRRRRTRERANERTNEFSSSPSASFSLQSRRVARENKYTRKQKETNN